MQRFVKRSSQRQTGLSDLEHRIIPDEKDETIGPLFPSANIHPFPLKNLILSSFPHLLSFCLKDLLLNQKCNPKLVPNRFALYRQYR